MNTSKPRAGLATYWAISWKEKIVIYFFAGSPVLYFLSNIQLSFEYKYKQVKWTFAVVVHPIFMEKRHIFTVFNHAIFICIVDRNTFFIFKACYEISR